MIEINTVNVQRFSFNGIEYFKNFLSKVSGNLITIYNAYDERDVRLPFENYTNVKVNGVTFNNVAALQSALLDVIYTRDSLGGSIYFGSEFNRFLIDKGYSLGVSNQVIINKDSEWLIKGINYKNTSEVLLPFTLAAAGKKRIDYIVANQNNTFEIVTGVEVADNLPATSPAIPPNKLAYIFITVTNSAISNPQPGNGSETKINAGTNVTVTGVGTDLNPYVINAFGGGGAVPGLQQVLNVSREAFFNNGDDRVVLLQDNGGGRYFDFNIVEPTNQSYTHSFGIAPLGITAISTFPNLNWGGLSINQMETTISRSSNGGTILSRILFPNPTVNSTVTFPNQTGTVALKENFASYDIFFMFSGSQSFTVPANLVVTGVFYNGRKIGDYTRTSDTVLTITRTLFTDDEINISGILK